MEGKDTLRVLHMIRDMCMPTFTQRSVHTNIHAYIHSWYTHTVIVL